MDYYRCENPDCGYIAEEEPDICPQCGGTFFIPLVEEDLTGGDWVNLGNRAVQEERIRTRWPAISGRRPWETCWD